VNLDYTIAKDWTTSYLTKVDPLLKAKKFSCWGQLLLAPSCPRTGDRPEKTHQPQWDLRTPWAPQATKQGCAKTGMKSLKTGLCLLHVFAGSFGLEQVPRGFFRIQWFHPGSSSQGFHKWKYSKWMVISSKILWKWMIWGYPHFWKPPCGPQEKIQY